MLAFQAFHLASLCASHHFNNVFTIKGDLQKAVDQYDANSTNATATYGPIAGWNVSQITDMAGLFERRNGLRKENFNARTRPVSRA